MTNSLDFKYKKVKWIIKNITEKGLLYNNFHKYYNLIHTFYLAIVSFHILIYHSLEEALL